MAFDPYHKWLGIPPEEQPASHYRLLGIAELESDADVIDGAAERQTVYLRTFQTGPEAELAERLLNEVAAARVCLLNPDSKAEYDAAFETGIGALQFDEPSSSRATVASGTRSKPVSKKNAETTKPIKFVLSVVLGGAGGIVIAILLLWFAWGLDPFGLFKKAPKQIAENSEKSDTAGAPRTTAPSDNVGTTAAEQLATKKVAAASKKAAADKPAVSNPLEESTANARAAMGKAAAEKAAADMLAANKLTAEKAIAEAVVTLKGHKSQVLCVAFSPNGKQIVSGGIGEPQIRVWDAETGVERLILKGHASDVWCVAFSPDGGQIASGSWDNTVKIWDAETGQQSYSFGQHTKGVHGIDFSPNGKWIVSGSWDGTVKMWDAQTGEEKLTFDRHVGHVYSVAFSPDGKRIVSGSGDSTVKVWDIESEQEIFTLKGHSELIYSVAISNDGKKIASGSFDDTVKIWDAQSGQVMRTLKGLAGNAYSVAFSRDGKRLVSGNHNSSDTVKVWDVDTGQEILTLRGHASKVKDVIFSPDGKRIASCSADGTVKVWRLPPLVDIVAKKSPPASLRNGLVAYYPFNGNAKNEARNGDHGKVHGAMLGTDRFGRQDSCYKFDGMDDKIVASGTVWPQGNSSRTVAVWFESSSKKNANIVSLGDGTKASRRFSLGMKLGKLFFSGQQRDHTFEVKSIHGKWSHYVLVYAEGTGVCYVQGSKTSQFKHTLDTDGSLPLVFGSNTVTRNDEFFNGSIDDVRIYNRALSAAEVKALYEFERHDSAQSTAEPTDSASPTANTAKPSTTRLAIPDEALTQMALSVIKEKFKDDYEKTNELEGREQLVALRELAEKIYLLQSGEEDLTTKYVVLDTAYNFARLSCHPDLTWKILDDLSQRYEVDSIPRGVSSLQYWSDQIPKVFNREEMPQKRVQLIGLILPLAKRAEQEYRFAIATELYELAINQVVGQKELLREFRQLRLDAKKKELLYEKATQLTAELVDSDDPEKHQELGGIWCFGIYDWKKGLPHLAQGSNKDLQIAAKLDLDSGPGRENAESIGDRWWELSLFSSHIESKAPMQARAVYWYDSAVAGDLENISGKLRQRINEAGYAFDANGVVITAKVLMESMVRNGLIAYYPFDRNAIDASGNGNHVEQQTNSKTGEVLLSFVTDRFGDLRKAIEIEKDKQLELPVKTLPVGNSPRTIMYWMKFRVDDMMIVPAFYGNQEHKDSCYFLIKPNGRLYLGDHDGTALELFTKTIVASGKWNHVALVHDGIKTSRAYVNGKEAVDRTAEYRTSPSTSIFLNFRFAHAPYSTGYGALDDLFIFDRALSADEIKILYDSTKP